MKTLIMTRVGLEDGAFRYKRIASAITKNATSFGLAASPRCWMHLDASSTKNASRSRLF